MSKESLDYQKLCSNYYSSWEEGCCMESCEFYNHNECPVVYVNGLLEERDKTIADLEAKLAKSQHENQEFISKYRYWRGECAELNKQLAEKDTKLHEYIRCALEDYNDNQKEIIELKQQLAEKDSTIKTLIEDSKASKELLKEQLAEKDGKIETLKQRIESIVKIYSNDFVSKDTELKELRYKVKQANQDKISFALEQLEKVKEKALHFYVNDTPKLTGFYIDVNEINNQIEELKKEILDGET